MASNKNQHFVPRCYLRPFTTGQGAAINLFNLDRRKFIENAPVKNQCSGDYFYGSDLALENALQSMERMYAMGLKEILAPGYRLTDEHRLLLLRFWLLQYARTEAASRRAIEMSDQMGSAAGVPVAEYKLGIKDAVQNSMQVFVAHNRGVDDLKVCLFRNCTSVPFVTSDDPAVLTNRFYLEDARTRGRAFGIKSAGVLAFLPLSPYVLCAAYDGHVYSVPNKNGWVRITNDVDVAAFNEHQFYNCMANIFVGDAAHAGVVQQAFLPIAGNRPATRIRLNYAVLDREENEHKVYKVVERSKAPEHSEAVMHAETVHARPTRWPTLLQWHPRPTCYTNGTGVGYVRGAWCSEFRGPFERVRLDKSSDRR